jgi:XTP/dITP diphosphohydrolase
MALPALIKAFRVQEKAANVGFDWEKPEQVWDKVREETAEVEAEIANQDHDKIEAEFGDLFFALVNAARLYKVNPENALERTNRKFIARFNHVEKRATEQGLKLKDMTLAQMDEFWNEAKSLGL